MCGLLGEIYLKKLNQSNLPKFKKSLNLLNHRGPDDTKIISGKNYIFGFKRLSIQDLSNQASQPMMTKNKNYILMLNGEIYNFKDLKKNLEKKGFNFLTTSDTEVLLYGLISEGIEFVKKCNGMFSFCFYDKLKNIFYLFRDRVGIKPLYYSIIKKKIIFSSEVPPILMLEPSLKQLDIESISSYFSYRYPINNKSYFKNILSLEPGHFIKITENNFTIHKYWEASNFFNLPKKDKGEEYYIDKLRELVKTSVKYHLISDAKVASLLSGGLDSSILSVISSKIVGKNFNAYSIGYRDKEYNEFIYANDVAKKNNIRHVAITSNSKKYFDNLDSLIDIKGAPLSIPNEVTQYELCNEIKKKAKVVLAGAGADEIFCGYGKIFDSTYDYQRAYKKKFFRTNKKYKSVFMKNFKLKYNNQNFSKYSEHLNFLYQYVSSDEKRKMLNNDLDLNNYNRNALHFIDKTLDKINKDDYLQKIQYFFNKVHLQGILLRDDNSSMAGSIELRVPFLDHKIVEFAAQIPDKYKIKWTTKSKKIRMCMISDSISENYDIPKYILRKSFDKILPKK